MNIEVRYKEPDAKWEDVDEQKAIDKISCYWKRESV